MYSYIRTIKDTIYLTKYVNGKKILERDTTFKPYAFLKCSKDVGWRSYPDNVNITPIQFSSVIGYRNDIKSYPSDMVYGGVRGLPEIQKIRGEKLNENYDLNNLKVFFFDIEVYSNKGFPEPNEVDFPVTAIAVQDKKTKKKYVWTITDQYKKHLDEVTLHTFRDEGVMLNHFFAWLGKSGVDVLCGWYSQFFDVPYLYNRGKKLIGKQAVNQMSPFGVVIPKREIKRKATKKDKDEGKDQDEIVNSCDIVGINCIDYLNLSKKYTQNERASWKLDDVAEDWVGEKKIDYGEEGSLSKLWLTNKQKYIEYNIQDTNLVAKIDEAKGYIDLAYTLCYYAMSPISNYASNTALWTAKLYNELLNRKQCPPSKGSGKGNMAGGFVKEPTPKRYGWTMSFDLASLYPMLIRQYNLSFETIIKDRQLHDVDYVDDIVNDTFDFTQYKKENKCFLPMGSVFSKEKKGLAPQLMETLYTERKRDKKQSYILKQESKTVTDVLEKKRLLTESTKMYNVQWAKKILLNSFFGAMKFGSFILFNKEIAESITAAGRVSIQWAEKRLNEYLNKVFNTKEIQYVYYCDTDSLYCNAQPFVDKIMDKNPTKTQIIDYLDNISKNMIEPQLKKIYQELFEYVGAYENFMMMDREIIAESLVITAKKRYAALVWDNEGDRYEEPEMKIMGLSVVRSDTPNAIKSQLKESVYKILTCGDIYKYIDEVRDDVYKMLPHEIASPTGVNGIEKYYEFKPNTLATWAKGAPGHVRAAIIYNNLIKRMNLEDKYPKIHSGEKMKYLYLKMPNPISMPVVGFTDKLPAEFNLEEYIDKNKIFHKIYEKTIKDMLDIIGLGGSLGGGFKLF